MRFKTAITKAVIFVLGTTLCGVPEVASAWQQPPAQATQPPVVNGTTVNPAQGPLAPVPAPTETPEAPAPQTQNAPTPSTQLSGRMIQPATKTPEPLGTAAAEGITTSGGGASRPAGSAIAPAKQHQTRSLLLKMGAIAAGGIAIGTIVALSKGTPSKPPGAH